MIDYVGIISAVNRLIKDETGRQIVEQLNTDEQPPYPFASYSVTSPNIARSRAYNGGEMITDTELVISYTWHSEDNIEALNMAQKSDMILNHPSTIQSLYDSGFAVVRIDGFGSRDTFLTIETERRVGFDVRLRTRHTDIKPLETIETVI